MEISKNARNQCGESKRYYTSVGSSTNCTYIQDKTHEILCTSFQLAIQLKNQVQYLEEFESHKRRFLYVTSLIESHESYYLVKCTTGTNCTQILQQFTSLSFVCAGLFPVHFLHNFYSILHVFVQYFRTPTILIIKLKLK